jgi:hypothetical protein
MDYEQSAGDEKVKTNEKKKKCHKIVAQRANRNKKLSKRINDQ